MNSCTFCGRVLPAQADFCGVCGQVVSPIVEDIADRPTGDGVVRLSQADAMTRINVSGSDYPHFYGPTQQISSSDYATIPSPTNLIPAQTEEEDEEEEKRRRAILLGLAGGAVIGADPWGGKAPMVQGTPQINSAPVVQGMPQTGAPWQVNGGLRGSPSSGRPGGAPPFQPPVILPSPPAYPAPVQPPWPGTQPPQTPPHPSPPGCAPWLIVILLPLLILVSIFGAGLTVFAPALTLSGSSGSNVAPGGSLHLHGSSFLPGSTITLTVDNGQPVQFARLDAPLPEAASQHNALSLGVLGAQAQLSPRGGNTLTASSHGTFDVTIAIGQDWAAGHHTIHASEGLSPRSASLSFTVADNGQVAPTPTATDTPAPTATDTATPVPTGTGAPITTAFSTITPNSVTFGPVGVGSTQPISTPVTINTTGVDTLAWTATWNQNQAAWLHLSNTSGQIQAPNSQTITVQANPSGLAAGTYNTTITFSSPQSANPLTLNVSLTVQAGCITISPATLNFTGVTGLKDPAPQTIKLNNCGLPVSWSGSASTNDGANWLSVNPTSGNIAAGGTQSITVAATNVATKLAAGTYQGSLVITSGSGQFTIPVTLTVQTPAVLSANTNTITASNCTPDQKMQFWRCFVSISSNKDASLNLDWSASSSGLKGINFIPVKGTLTPGQTTRVEIDIPFNNCPQTITLTFTGPNNTVKVDASGVCTPLLQ